MLTVSCWLCLTMRAATITLLLCPCRLYEEVEPACILDERPAAAGEGREFLVQYKVGAGLGGGQEVGRGRALAARGIAAKRWQTGWLAWAAVATEAYASTVDMTCGLHCMRSSCCGDTCCMFYRARPLLAAGFMLISAAHVVNRPEHLLLQGPMLHSHCTCPHPYRSEVGVSASPCFALFV
jgi:hypothetical protein